MAATTPRFGFNWFDSQTDGDITDDALKFTGEDRLTLDSILAALEKHDHHRVEIIGQPNSIPTATYDIGGELESGTEYFYVVSFVTADGLETISGPETSVTTPDVLAIPIAPSAVTSDATGTLTEGIYYYAVTGLRDAEESGLSDFTVITVLDDENTVTITLPPLGDAQRFQIWRQKETEETWTRIGITDAATFTDDGSVPPAQYGDPDNVPPDESDDEGQYLTSVTLTGDDLSDIQDPNIVAWRLYRTTDSGNYSAASLVHEVVERTVETDPTSPLLSYWIDDGDEPLTGSPKRVTNQLAITPYTFEKADTLPASSSYPSNYPLVSGDTLYYNKNGTWTALSGGGGSQNPDPGSGGGFDFRGAYVPATQYPADAVVTYNNGLWQANVPTSAVPGTTTGGTPIQVVTHPTLPDQQPVPTGYWSVAQQFQIAQSVTVSAVQLHFNNNQPAGQYLAVAFSTSADITTGLISTGYYVGSFPSGLGYFTFPLSAPVTLPANTDIWVAALYGDDTINPGLNLGLQGGQSSDLTFTGSSYSRQIENGGPFVTDPDYGGYMLVFKLNANTPVISNWDNLTYTVPPGGSTGQVLTKSANTNGSYAWSAPTGGGGSSGVVHRMLTSDLVVSAAGQARIYTDGVSINPGETWELKAELAWVPPNATLEWYIIGAGISSATVEAAEGELWYPVGDGNGNTYSSIKYVSNPAIGTGSQDTGPVLSLNTGGGRYPVRLRYVVTNTSGAAINASFGTYLPADATSGQPLTLKTGSFMRATRIA